MKKLITRHRKILAVAIAATLLAPAMLTGARVFGTNPAAVRQAGEEELLIASDISNLTGVPLEKILDMRMEGLTWNEILDRLKGEKVADADREDMDRLLATESLRENVVDTLLDMGFDRDEITAAKLIVERLMFNLEEITSFGENDEYRNLKSLIDIGRAVYYMLVLQDDFGDMHKVLDEYLLTLQTGLELGIYIEDSEKYEEEKLQKIASTNVQIITCRMIEEKMLDTVQSRADIHNEQGFVNEHMNKSPVRPDSEIPEIRPELPKIEDVRPVNPAQGLMDEIKLINPMQ